MSGRRPGRGRIALPLVVLLGAVACTTPVSDRVADLPTDPTTVTATAPPEPHARPPLEKGAAATGAQTGTDAAPAVAPGVDPREDDEPAPTATTPIELTYETAAVGSVVTATITTAVGSAEPRAVAITEIEPGTTHTFADLAPGAYTVIVEERSAVVAEPDVGHAWSFVTRTDPVVVDDTVDPIVIRCATNEGCTAGTDAVP